MKRWPWAFFALPFLSHPAMANVGQSSDRAFVIRQVAEVPGTPEEAWALLVEPSQWWNPAHTFSGDAANLSLDVRAGGCWCEILRNPDSPNAAPLGSVEHLRVLYTERGRALRLSGALGPLQSEAVVGTLTFQFKPGESGTRILLEYVVSGYMRMPIAQMAPAVDGVLGEQLTRLAERLGGGLITMAPAQAPSEQGDESPVLPIPEQGNAPIDDAAPPAILPVDPDAAADDGFQPQPIEGR